MDEEKTIASAAAAAGMSERSAYTWKQGLLPSDSKAPRLWRTRSDPFAAVWESEVVPLLVSDQGGVLEGKTILSDLRRRHGATYDLSQLRTLQRRMQEWRALHGPAKEVMFEQRHEAGREGAYDFTDASGLGITIAGEVFAHLLFQFVLSFSKWRWVGLA
ncbi:MAG: IS21 family transposase, partial [Chloroflexi bacterium]|nr:IS21 family transposase [Chloroflexota bacterium]